MQVVELPAGVGPTGCQHDTAAHGQPFESGVTINLQNAAESFEVRGGSLRLAVGAVEVDGGRRVWSAPRPIVARIDPQSAHFGAATAWVEHRDRRVIGEYLARPKNMRGHTRLQRLEPPARTANPVGQGRTIDLDAMSGEDLSL